MSHVIQKGLHFFGDDFRAVGKGKEGRGGGRCIRGEVSSTLSYHSLIRGNLVLYNDHKTLTLFDSG